MGKKNPIPSMKVWFDHRDLKAVVCFDNTVPGAIANEACNNGEFHTHAWEPLGWLDMNTFVQAKAPEDLAAAFLRELCLTQGRIRLAWEEQEQRIRDRENTIAEQRSMISNLESLLEDSQEANGLLKDSIKMILQGKAPTDEMMERVGKLMEKRARRGND